MEDLGAEKRQDQGSFGLVPYSGVSAMWHRCFETWRSRGCRIDIDTEAREERWRLLYRDCRSGSAVRVYYKEAMRKERIEFEVLHEAKRPAEQSISQ